MAERSNLSPAAYPTRQPLTLLSVCEGRCTPRWKPPWKASTLTSPMVFFSAAGFFALISVIPVILGILDPEIGFLPSFVLFLGFVLAATLAAVPGWLIVRRPVNAQRHVCAGERTPVSVYYARTNESNLTVADRRSDMRRQPLLLMVAADGRMWTATPDITSFYASGSTAVGGGRRMPTGGSHIRNNPWIAPLHALVDRDRRPVLGQATLAGRPLPVDLGAPPQEPVRAALAALGQGTNNDPRFVGGPVPGELLLASPGRQFKLPYTRQPLTAGLVLHRPGDAPAQAPLHRYGGMFEHLFFGADPGLCPGFYLTELTPQPAS